MKKILIVGGYGTVGSTVAQLIRKIDPDVSLMLSGRNPLTGAGLVAELDPACSTFLDIDESLPNNILDNVDLVIAALHDKQDTLLNQCLKKGVSYIGISKSVRNFGTTVYRMLNRPPKMPVIIAGHWQAGAVIIIAREAAKTFAKLSKISVCAVYDKKDAAGPMFADELNFRSSEALLRVSGRWQWSQSTKSSRLVKAKDGYPLEAFPMATLDLPALAGLTDAADIRFDLVVSDSIGTINGKRASHDVYIDLEGIFMDGRLGSKKVIASCPDGYSVFTAAGVLAMMEQVLECNHQPVTRPLIYLPETLDNNNQAFDVLVTLGIIIEQLRN